MHIIIFIKKNFQPIAEVYHQLLIKTTAKLVVYLSKGSFLKLQWSAVGLSEGIIPDARYAWQILARRWWRHILNRGSMEEMKVNDAVDFQPIAEVYHQLLIKCNSKISGIPLKRVFF